MLQPLQDPLKRFTDQVVTEVGYIVFQESGRTLVKNGGTGQIEYSDVEPRMAIQYAVDKASLAGGGRVLVKAGEYKLNGRISMKSNVVLEGEGRSTRLSEGYIDFLTEGLENVAVRNLFIDNRGVGGCLWVAPPPGSVRWGPSKVLLENLILYGSNDPNIGHATIEIRSARNVVIRNCEVAYGGHNGIYITRVGEGYEPSDIVIQGCYIHDNYDDAIDPNYAKRVYLLGNYIANNESSCCSIENNCEDIIFVGNYVVGGKFIDILDSNRVLIANNYLYMPTTGERFWSNSSFIAFISNFYGPMAFIRVGNIGAPSHSVSIIGNHLWNCFYNQVVIRVVDSKGFVIKNNYFNSWNPNANRTEYVHPIIVEGTADDYEVSGNFFEVYTVCRAKFVGSRYRARDNVANRRGSWLAAIFHDYDGTMTGTAGTAFTFEPQQGEVTDIDTGTTGARSGSVSFPVRYPTGKIPRVILTLKDVASGVVIDTVYVSNVSETGFTWNLNVVTAVSGTTCKLIWRAELS